MQDQRLPTNGASVDNSIGGGNSSSSSSSSSSEDADGRSISRTFNESIYSSRVRLNIADPSQEEKVSIGKYMSLHILVAAAAIISAGTLCFLGYKFTRDQEINQFEAKVGERKCLMMRW